MMLQRLAARCVVMCVALGALVSQAAAHGSENAPTGIVTVPPSGIASIVIADTSPGDTLQWGWNASVSERVSVQLLWHDLGGREHVLSPDRTRQPFGMFMIPAEFSGARLVWRNTGNAPVEVEWIYHASAPFWRHPDMILPALIPFIFLIVAYPLGRAIDILRWRARHP